MCIRDRDKVRWYHKEMDAEEIRAYIGKCRFLVASRFHAMIGSLEQKVPVLLIEMCIRDRFCTHADFQNFLAKIFSSLCVCRLLIK